MMKVLLDSGKLIYVEDSESLLYGLKNSNMFSAELELGEWLEEVKLRVLGVHSTILNTEDYDVTVEQLEKLGVINIFREH